MKNKKAQGGPIIGVVVVLLFVGLIFALASFDLVDASHKGVKVRLGQVTGTMEPGMQYTGVLTQVYQYDLRVRKMTVEMSGNQGAVDKDGQSVTATIEINYKLNPTNVARAYSEIGIDEQLADTLRIEGIVKEGFKTVTSQYSSLEIFQKREEVKQKAQEFINSKFPQDFFSLENIIISNIDFNQAFKDAIEQKKVAEELAKAKEQEVLVNKFEADKQIETARGVAESKKLQAEANAYEIERIAEAEARALELKAQELTPLMVQNNWIDAWGKGANVPTYVAGQSGNSFLMQMPTSVVGTGN
jgi:regulator of protease activity HflC (stomatin/prohibitin superfamily)